MAYQTGAASSPSDFLTKLCSFAAANGWTVDNPSGGGKVVSRGDVVAGFYADSADLYSRGATSVNTGSAWSAQPGNSGVSNRCNLGAGPFTSYHAYIGAEDGSDYIHAVVEISPGIFRHVVIGELVRYGSYTGGQYCDSTFVGLSYQNYPDYQDQYRVPWDSVQEGWSAQSTGHIRCEIDGQPNAWRTFVKNHYYNSVARAFGDMRAGGGLNPPLAKTIGVVAYNLLTPLWPIMIYADRPSSLRSIIGRVPHARSVNMRLLFPGEVISIGGDDWQVWPLVARTNVHSQGYGENGFPPSSGYYGVAYKRTS